MSLDADDEALLLDSLLDKQRSLTKQASTRDEIDPTDFSRAKFEGTLDALRDAVK
eukprot:CAMPEP_0198338002 /NCGR_PEP_ID=MMETSP1450-20131203/32195_1 /TAXON_ID=753684 ORGANISM="Madagascaria erythrocladiodes, Strain CCMP3234" /NCGR_SAMPLE_ID=MMETSP1450 /ASSEMBLY_ACC=CAM_ASM_001115 /LENGTH=54 /DNA_ID=CAMNT_0044042853 /DNA_START=62 /DNA_END=223 /DNA_ORIENTATION=+